MVELPGFDEGYYLENKLETLKTDPTYAHITTTDQLKQELALQGLTPELHYKQFGSSENISTSAYFNKIEYLESKLLSLRENPETAGEWANKNIVDLETSLSDMGLTPAEHYARYGFAETRADGTLLNPSNAFDSNAYFAAKLVELQKQYPDKYTDMTVAEVVKQFQKTGVDPVSHYMSYGASEAQLSDVPLVQTVPTSQRVPEDPKREAMNSLVPDNPAPPSLPPSKATAAVVPTPGDMGGYDPETTVPPAKQPVPTPDIPGLRPDQSGGASGGESGGSSGGESGGSSGGESGGSSGGESGGESGGGTNPPTPPVEPEPLPEKDPIQLSAATSVVTPLASVDAGDRFTGNNQNDTIEIVDPLAYFAQLDAGACNDGRWEQENDKLILSVDTPADSDVINMRATNFETVVLGEGAQKVHLGDYKKYGNYNLKHVSFDNEGDQLVLDDNSTVDWKTITNKGEGQGSILYQNRPGHSDSASMNLQNVEWNLEGQLKEIVFKNISYTSSLSINAQDLDKVGKITATGKTGYYTDDLNLYGYVGAIEGTSAINDSHVEKFTVLNLTQLDIAPAETLAFSSQYRDVRLGTVQMQNLQKIQGQADNLILTQSTWDDTTVAMNNKAVAALMKQGAADGFTTLTLESLSTFDGLDAKNADFTTISFNSSEGLKSFKGKTINGRADQTLTSNWLYDQDAWTTLGSATGFTSLNASIGLREEEQTLRLAENNAFRSLTLYDGYSDGVSEMTFTVHDTNTENNVQTLTLDVGRSVYTKGIENIVASQANLDTRSFDAASGLTSVSGSHLALHGDLTDATKAALSDGKVKVNTLSVRWLDLKADESFDMSKLSGTTLYINADQCAKVSVENVNNVSIYGTEITTKLVNEFRATKADLSAPTYALYGENTSDTINMTGYSNYLHIDASGTITGGDGSNYLYGRHGTQVGGTGNDSLYVHTERSDDTLVQRQNGGAGDDSISTYYRYGSAKSLHQDGGVGNDTLSMEIYRKTVEQNTQNGGDGDDTITLNYNSSYMVPDTLTLAAHKMTGGAGKDAFKLECNMDSVLKEPHETNTTPGTKLIITDFSKTDGDTLSLSDVYYTRMNEETEQMVDFKFKAADFIATAAPTTKFKLDEALNEVAETITTGKIGYFHLNGNTYIFGNNDQNAVDKGDLVIELTGVTEDLASGDLILAS